MRLLTILVVPIVFATVGFLMKPELQLALSDYQEIENFEGISMPKRVRFSTHVDSINAVRFTEVGKEKFFVPSTDYDELIVEVDGGYLDADQHKIEGVLMSVGDYDYGQDLLTVINMPLEILDSGEIAELLHEKTSKNFDSESFILLQDSTSEIIPRYLILSSFCSLFLITLLRLKA